MSKTLPQGLELTYGGNGLDTVRVSMSFNEAIGIVSVLSQLHSCDDRVILLLHGWLEECQGEKEYRKRKATRLRLLEAVAKAARVDTGEWLDRTCSGVSSIAEHLAGHGNCMAKHERVLLEALVALEEYGG